MHYLLFQIGWMLVLYAQNVYYLYLARLLNGFMGAGLYMIIPQFFTEIASDRYVNNFSSLELLSKSSQKCKINTIFSVFEVFLDQRWSFQVTSVFCWHSFLEIIWITLLHQKL